MRLRVSPRTTRLAWVGWVLCLWMAGTAGEPGVGRGAAWQDGLAAFVSQPRFAHARWGVRIESADTGEVGWETNANLPLIPASNTKLFTAAIALDRLGPEFRIRTSLFGASRPTSAGFLKGDLRVYGRGDPGWSTRTDRDGRPTSLGRLAEALKAAGVRHIEGAIVADESGLDGPARGAGWETEDQPFAYAPEVSALSVNDNAAELLALPAAVVGQPARLMWNPSPVGLVALNRARTVAADRRKTITFDRPSGTHRIVVLGAIPVGSAPAREGFSVPQPAAWFGEILRAELTARGVAVQGGVRVVSAGSADAAAWARATPLELASVESPPLREWLGRMMKPSQNLHAELILRLVGAQERSLNPRGGTRETPPTSAGAGIVALQDWLRRAGIPAGTVHLEEGAGLSRANRVTAAAVVRLLTVMAHDANGVVFCDSLPLASVDGTLAGRFKGTVGERNVRAKTGSLGGVSALSGYARTAVGEHVVFAVLLNGYSPAEGDPPARAEVDALVNRLLEMPAATGRRSGERSEGRVTARAALPAPPTDCSNRESRGFPSGRSLRAHPPSRFALRPGACLSD